MADSDIVSNFSSIADAPDHLETQYDPLGDVFKVHPHLLPSPKTPESNSDAMIKALKALQEKIRHLEVERVSAADRLRYLERKTTQTPKQGQHSSTNTVVGVGGIGAVPQVRGHPPPGARELAQDQQELQRRLESIDRKFSQQAHELRKMRKQFEEHSKSPPGYDTVDAPGFTTPRGKGRVPSPEKHQGTSSRERMTRSESPIQVRRPLKRKKTRTTQKSYRKRPAEPLDLCRLAGGKPQPGVHYRLDMRDVPFVAGTSLSPSHSIAANYQRVVSLMKAHNPLLCGAVAASNSKKLRKQKYATGKSRPSPPPVTLAELEALLSGLEEELGELTFRHQQLALKADSPSVKGQLKQLVDDLEEKAMQIDIVKRQIDYQRTRKVHKKPSSARKLKRKETQEVFVDDAGFESRGDFLRRIKTLQNTLQSDDLTWK